MKEFLAFWRAAEELGPADLGLGLGADADVHQLDVASLALLFSGPGWLGVDHALVSL